MTQKHFISRLMILARICEFQLPDELMALYDRGLSRFGYDSATAAVEAAILERRGNDRMPSIGDLVQRCAPQVLDADTAVEVAGRIWTAIARFGHNNLDDARNWIGEVGWHVVVHNGGWEQICQTAQSKDVGTWRAQLRDHAAATLRRHKAGVLGEAPRFGEIANPKMAALVGDVIKKREESIDSSRNARDVPRQPGPRQLDAQGATRVPETV